MADMDGWPLRIQVKTSRRRTPAGGYDVALATRGGNQSWSGVAKLSDTSRCDYLFVVVADGRRWFIPATEVAAKVGIVVGGAKWRRFEVDAGPPLADGAGTPILGGLDSLAAPGGAPELESRDGL